MPQLRHRREPVAFHSCGATLRGLLYRPEPAPETSAAVVMAHGFSATIGMVAENYAEAIADAGFTVVLYDHRGFGASGGEPRHEINPWVQARGYRDAVTFASSLPGVDPSRIALWGDSLSAAEALVVAAVDGRVAAVIAQVPATGSHSAPSDSDARLFRLLRDTLAHGDVDGGRADRVGPMAVVSADQLSEPSLLKPIEAYRWFMEYGGRVGARWKNEATRVVTDTPVQFHAGIAAPHVHCPVLMHIAPADEMEAADPVVAHEVAAAIAGPTEVIEIDGGHFGLLYAPSGCFDYASNAQTAFLARIFG